MLHRTFRALRRVGIPDVECGTYFEYLGCAGTMMKKGIKKRGFPFGLFVLLLLLLTVLSSAVTGGYFYFTTRRGIENVVSNTRSCAQPLAEALAQVAELSYRVRDYSALKTLINKKIEENIIDEAFFVRYDGSLVAHSKSDVEKRLGGNIASDEFSYNTDLILYPLRSKSKEIHFIDYNIMGKQVPFGRLEKHYLKKYLYNRIDTSGWLVTRAVYASARGKEEPVGTVNFIISKEKIFSEVLNNFRTSLLLAQALGAASFLLALFIALAVFLRYRNLYRLWIAGGSGAVKIPAAEIAGDYQESVPIDADSGALVAGDGDEVPWRAGDKKNSDRAAAVMRETLVDVRKPIRDAIPVIKRNVQD